MYNLSRTCIFLLFAIVSIETKAEIRDSIYLQTYSNIESMLSSKDSTNFQQAVYLTENAYFDNQLDKTAFDAAVKFNTSICRGIIASGNIQYPDSLTKSQKSHLLGLIVMSEGQFWNDRFEKDSKKREKIKEDLGRISKAFGHLLLTQLKNSSLPDDFTSEELNDISLALETYVDVCYRIYNKKLALEICELALEKFPERFNSRFKRKKEKIVGYRSYYMQTKPSSEPARESKISELGVKLKDALNQLEIINLEIAENGYNGEILRIYDDKAQYGYIKLQSDDIMVVYTLGPLA
jgi:hypothetical protein